jgi:hypothetical protein
VEAGHVKNKFFQTPGVPADGGSSHVVIRFPSDWFWVDQFIIGVLGSVWAFKVFVDGHPVASILLIVTAMFLILLRAKFKIRSPKWVSIDPINKTMRVKQRWPHRTETAIDISKLSSIEAYVPRFQRFPYSVVQLNFDGLDKQTIYFGVESNETRFFATPNEVVPVSVEELVKVLRNSSTPREKI